MRGEYFCKNFACLMPEKDCGRELVALHDSFKHRRGLRPRYIHHTTRVRYIFCDRSNSTGQFINELTLDLCLMGARVLGSFPGHFRFSRSGYNLPLWRYNRWWASVRRSSESLCIPQVTLYAKLAIRDLDALQFIRE